MKKTLFVAIAIMVISVLFSACTILSSNVQAPTPITTPALKENVENFLFEAEKLKIMTEQGVTRDNFAIQLAETTTRYFLIKDKLPPKYDSVKSDLDKAIWGWELVSRLYAEQEREAPVNYMPDCNLEEDNPVALSYLNLTYNPTICEEYINLAMSKASEW